MNRRDFIQHIGSTTVIGSLIANACQTDKPKYRLSEFPTNSKTGHLLRQAFEMPLTYKQDHTDILIVGSGISALSACRILEQKGTHKIKIIELADHIGGNASGGKNKTSAYPWAAHYLPIPGLHLQELIDFLADANIIKLFKNGLPEYNEEYVCHDNEERLYINGKWQKGLIPEFNIPPADRLEISKFLKTMQVFKSQKGKDGKYAFEIPINLSSTDLQFSNLHSISAKEWLIQEQFKSSYLHWYIHYCMSDDYGSSIQTTSAWAMLHYFASRRGQGANVNDDDILTWPEGNAFLAKKLVQQISTPIQLNEIALQVFKTKDNLYEVYHLNTKSNEWTKTICNKLILNTPYHVSKRLIPSLFDPKEANLFQSYPWIVANITLHLQHEKSGMPLSWDNVIFQSSSLGFINATHQSMNRQTGKTVLTYYKALNTSSAKEEREALYSKSLQQIATEITEELDKIYPNSSQQIETIEIKKIGHGMISPQVNLLTTKAFQRYAKPIDSVYFCHTDFCGISIFEEAFYKGIQTAKSILNA